MGYLPSRVIVLVMGNIGKPLRTVEFEPMPEDVPVREPSPPVAPEPVPAVPAVPVPVPA
jgi:hypothetical protein